MRKTIFGLLPLAALLMGSCQADTPGAGGLVPFMLTSTVVDGGAQPAATRTTSTALQSTQLAASEAFYAYFGSGVINAAGTAVTATTYTADGSGGTTAADGSLFLARSASSVSVCAYHGKSGGSGGTQVTNATTSFSVGLDQSTDAGYKASDLMYATASADKNIPTTTAALTFTHKMAKIIVNVTLGTGITSVTDVRIVGGKRTVNIANPTTANEASAAYLGTTLDDAITAADNACVKLFDGSTTAYTSTAAPLACTALIPPQTVGASEAAAFLQVATNTGTATYSVSNKAFASGQSYTYNITVTAAAVGLTTDITDWTGGTTQNLYNNGSASVNVEAVDLGLPSGTKWANMNVGASSPTDYGTFFAWGETDGITVSGATTTISGTPAKTYFSWDTYAWSKGTNSTLTKYCPTEQQSSYWWDTSGTTVAADNKTQLELVDDAARANWGGKWRMPTYDELNELLTSDKISSRTWTTQDGVYGYLFTATNGNSIFLPAAGYRRDASFDSQGSYGNYWSSTLDTDNPYLAWILYFNSSGAYVYNYYFYRYNGFTVRAVQSN